MASQTLMDVCADRVVGTTKWIKFTISLALKGVDSTCAPALQRILDGNADTDVVLQVASSLFGVLGGASKGGREKLSDLLQGLKALRAAPDTPWVYAHFFLRACGGGMAKAARILEIEFNSNKATPALDRLPCIWEFLAHRRTELTKAIQPLVIFFRETENVSGRLAELASDPPAETTEPQVVVVSAAELLALTKTEHIEDVVKEASRFLECFASEEESTTIHRRRDALLLLHEQIETGNSSTQKDVCSALANVARRTSLKSFATWIQDVGSSAFSGAYSVADGLEVLRKLTSVQQMGSKKAQVRRLVEVMDNMRVFRRGRSARKDGTKILAEFLLLVQELQPQTEMQELLNRIAVWVNFCGDHESFNERLDAYIVGGGLRARKLEKLHESACKFNANLHEANVDIDSLHHMQDLYKVLLEENNYSTHVVSHAMPLMQAVHLLQNMADDDIQYKTAFASFLAVVSLLQLEKADMLSVNTTEPERGLAAAGSTHSTPRPPRSKERHSAVPPEPPTIADENASKRPLHREHSADDFGDSATLACWGRSDGDCGLSSDGSQHGRPSISPTGGAGSHSTSDVRSTSSISTPITDPTAEAHLGLEGRSTSLSVEEKISLGGVRGDSTEQMHGGGGALQEGLYGNDRLSTNPTVRIGANPTISLCQ